MTEEQKELIRLGTGMCALLQAMKVISQNPTTTPDHKNRAITIALGMHDVMAGKFLALLDAEIEAGNIEKPKYGDVDATGLV